MPEIGERRVRTATFVVAASDSMVQDKTMADYICTGVNDHLVIQAALDALPATGGEVKLLDGTYNIEVSLVMDSYQTLRGCGYNTVLTTSTALSGIITALGGAGTEKQGIVIADLRIDAASTAYAGIYWDYVDNSEIRNVWVHDCSFNKGVTEWGGIELLNCDFDKLVGNSCIDNLISGIQLGDYIAASGICTEILIEGNTCQGNGYIGISLYTSNNNTVTDNNCQANTEPGIHLDSSSNNTVTGNTCQGNGEEGIRVNHSSNNNTVTGNTCTENGSGIGVTNSNNNTVTGNTCQGNNEQGIYLTLSSDNTVMGNTSLENSQVTNNIYDDIALTNSSNNNVQCNTCRAGGLGNKPRYGISIHSSCQNNLFINNDLYDDGFGTASFGDAGILTYVEDNNRGIEIVQIKMYRRVKNTSGVQRVLGDVISLKAVAAGNEVTAPAAVGERQVYGMVAETIDNNASGLVLVKGFTDALKATNVGGGNIAIGDFLITENGVRARKNAAVTDPIFARALEACAAANCTIDAFIMSLWD